MNAALEQLRPPSAADCVRCGLCLESCPTYTELRTEADSPRGRIAIMRAIDDGRLAADAAAVRHLDLCLDCRACETACPSGVRYGSLIESMRARLADKVEPGGASLADRLREYVLFRVLPDRRRLRRWLAGWRLLQATGLPEFLETTGLARRLGLPALPKLDDVGPQTPLQANHRAARGNALSVSLFVGCVTEAATPQTNRAAIRVLNRGGCDVACPGGQVCCGAIHYHAGRVVEARAYARANVDAFASVPGEVIVTAGGCGAMLRHYAELLADDAAYAVGARDFVTRVRDVHAFLADRPMPSPRRATRQRVTYHDACHLCHAQGIRREPRALLRSIPGLELAALDEAEMCCGAAGSYSLSQPEMSARLAARKWEFIRRTGADVVAAANVGCILQMRQHAPADLRHVAVRHPIEILDEALGSIG